MKSVETWFSEYSESHQNPVNKNIHWICVPLIYFTVIGLFWSIPVPSLFQSVPYLNFATIALVLSLAFYLRLAYVSSRNVDFKLFDDLSDRSSSRNCFPDSIRSLFLWHFGTFDYGFYFSLDRAIYRP